MTHDSDTNEIVFSTGKRIRSYSYILGLDAEGDGEVYYGHDGGFSGSDLTTAERVELALEMIARWTRFALGL